MLEQKMKVDIYSATFAQIDGGQIYTSLYIGQPVYNESEENTKGLSIMKMSCDPSVYSSIDLSTVPLKAEIMVRLKKGAGGKMNNVCTGIVVQPKPLKAS